MIRQTVFKKRRPGHSPQSQPFPYVPIEIQHGILPKFSLARVEGLPTSGDLKELLACCTNCGGIPPRTSFVCADGHMTCVECVRNSTTDGCSFVPTEGQRLPSEPRFGTLPQCSKLLKRRPCFAYNEIFSKTLMVCSNQPCKEVYYGKDVSEHQRTCIGSKNLSCLEPECAVEGKWSQESLLTHLLEEHHVEMDRGLQRLFYVEPWWFATSAPRVTYMMKFKNTVWIGMAMKEVVDGEEACIFFFYQVSNVGCKKSDKLQLEYEANLIFQMKEGRRSHTWRGAPPSIHETKDQILKEKKCLIVHADPTEVLYLEMDINPIIPGDPDRYVGRHGWMTYFP